MKYKTRGFKRAFVLVLAVALLVAGGSVLYWRQVTQRLEQDVRSTLRAVSRELSDNIARLLSAQLQVLTAVSVSLEGADLQDRAWLTGYLNQQDRRNSFELLGIQFPNGETVFSNGAVKKNFLPRAAVDFVYEHSHYISPPEQDPFNSQRQVLVLAVPLRVAGQRRGVVFATQSVAVYTEALRDTPLDEEGLAFITDASGKVLLAYPGALFGNIFSVVGQARFDDPSGAEMLQQDMAQRRGGITGYTLRGHHRFASYYPLGYNEWYAMSVLPTSSMAEKARSLVLFSLLICLSIILALGVLLAFILRMQYQNAKALYKMGFVDSLTGMDNINAFQLKFPAVAAAWKEKNIPAALVLVNVDRFKAVNDMYGLDQGDRVLRQLAQNLHGELAEEELLCRSGADVFLLLLACPDRDELGRRVETVLARAGHVCLAGEERVPVSLTGGVYVLDEPVPFYMMLDRANLAWAEAKQRAGGSYAFYDRESLRRLVTEKRIENSMDSALQNREFTLYLQPKCDFKTGRTVSAEALVRWQHPTQGVIRPDQFIPVFEKNGFVLKLDWFIFQEVVQTLRRWQDEKRPLVPVGINFSRLHLEDAQFIDTLARTVAEAGVPPELLEVELTESVVVSDVQRMKQVLDGLHQKGFSVAMDDFGAGYSSLNVLKELDFDCVKLDKEFLARGEGNPRMREVISGLVKMIQKLHTRVVAEGVETAEQAAFLRGIGCDMAQGYLFSRPLPVAEFEKRLSDEIK